ncbi:2-hydroxyacyl-CoA dehydratase [Thermodesulfobacteriota bacterium]
MSEQRNTGQLEIPKLVRAYQREWLARTRERVSQGEPFIICNGDDYEDMANAMDIPVIVINYWHSLISMKGLAEYYYDVLAKKGYPSDYSFALGLACSMDRDPEMAPWGGLPKPLVILGGAREDREYRVVELWAREMGATFWPLECALWHAVEKPPGPNWWERIRDHWDEFVNPYKLDLRVEQEKELTKYIEVATGKRLTIDKLTETAELVNEQMDYWKMAHDLIAATVPCPARVRDQLSMYQTMWHRGTPTGRDFIKSYYEEVKDRVEKGIAACPNEKIRLMWLISLGTPPAWGQWAEDTYNAVCVASGYSAIPFDGYPRTILDNDPGRALAARHMLMSWTSPDWHLKETLDHQCDGIVVATTGGSSGSRKELTDYCDKVGMPIVEIPYNKDDEKVRAIISEFIETHLSAKL